MQWNWSGVASSIGTMSVGAALAFGGTAMNRDPAPAPAPELAPRIGVLDLATALSADPLGRAAAKELEDWMVQQQEIIDTQDANVLKLEAEIQEYDEGSEEYMQRAETIMFEKYKLELRVERMSNQANAKQAQDLKESFARIRQAAETIRKNRGLEVVLQINPSPLKGRNSADVISEMIARTTLAYDARQVDITVAVIDLLKS